MDIFSWLWLIWFGWILGIIVQHFLNRSAVVSERLYNFKKEELFKYKKVAEDLVEKLILLDWQSELFFVYFQWNANAVSQKWAIYVDLNNTLDKSDFEENKWKIASSIFLYFPKLSDSWNECLDLMWKMHSLVAKAELHKEHNLPINWKELIDEFNEINQKLWNKPHEIAKSIKQSIEDMENSIINQKSTFIPF